MLTYSKSLIYKLYTISFLRHNQDNRTKLLHNIQILMHVAHCFLLQPNLMSVVSILVYPLPKLWVSDLGASSFATETISNHKIIEISPVGNILCQLVFLIYLPPPNTYFLSQKLFEFHQLFWILAKLVEQFDYFFSQAFEFFFGITAWVVVRIWSQGPLIEIIVFQRLWQHLRIVPERAMQQI